MYRHLFAPPTNMDKFTWFSFLVKSLLVFAQGLPMSLLSVSGESAQTQTASVTIVRRTIQIPLDHTDPKSKAEPFYYELGAAFDRAKPTVSVIADAAVDERVASHLAMP